MSDKLISLEGIAKRYPAPGGATTTIFENLWLTMNRGEFTCVIGHSGCGKTTVLNILAGLDTPSDGAVIVDDQEIDRAEPRPRGDLPEPRAAAVAHRDGQRRLCGVVEVAQVAVAPRCARTRRNSSIWSASPARSTSGRPSCPAA